VQEIEISGDLACCWNVLTVRVTPIAGGNTAVRTGNALSILRKQANGSWIGRARRKHVVGGIVTPHSASGLTYDVDRVGGAEIAIVNG
jgi:ketosteroid isomerase-like protein